MLIVGNWKMNGSRQMAVGLIEGIRTGLTAGTRASVVVCPPSVYLSEATEWISGSRIGLGAQTCHGAESGAYTGDVAAAMLAEIGVQYVIVGHSERRQHHGETDNVVCDQAAAAIAAGLVPIICVGETEAERDAGDAGNVVAIQIERSVPATATIDKVVIAYEPIWAIGTGRTPSTDDIAAMHGMMSQVAASAVNDTQSPPLLYGGSVKPGNAAEILAIEHVDGALVGGASLNAEDFLGIINAA